MGKIEIREYIKKSYNSALSIKGFLSIMRIKPAYFLFPTILSMASASFEGLSIGLLLPLAKGITDGDFGFVKNLPVFKILIAKISYSLDISDTVIFILLIATIVISSVLKNILQYFSGISTLYLLRRATNVMRKLIFERYLSFGKMFFDRTNVGYLHNIIINYTGSVTASLEAMHNLLVYIFTLLVYIIIMFIISWKLTLFTILIFPISHYSCAWILKRIEMTSNYYADESGEINKKIFNVLTCIPLVKGYSNEVGEKNYFNNVSNLLERLEFSIDKKRILVGPIRETVLIIAILLLISFVAFIKVQERGVLISNFLVYFYIIRRAAVFFGIINESAVYIATAAGPIRDIRLVFDDRDKFFIADGAREFNGLKQGIAIRNLNFSYVEGVEVLKDISLTVEKGEKVAIVGPTGVGKTTIVNLLMRFYDCPPSSIFIDGVDIREFKLESLRSNIAFASQDTLLFNDMLKSNIIYGLKREVNDNEFNEVIKKAQLHTFVMSLPKGIDTYIGDRGVQLSGGEKQRVAIARALLKNSEILILDEATSSLDTITEKLIQEAIDEVLKNRTAVIIAHRLSTIKGVDKIVVIEDGRLVEEGPLNLLLERKGRFYKYWSEQKFF